MFSPSSTRKSYYNSGDGSHGGLSRSAIEELSFNLPSNRQRPAPLRRKPSQAGNSGTSPSNIASYANNANGIKSKSRLSNRNKARSRPNTGNSAFSETFMRPWSWRKPKPLSDIGTLPTTVTPKMSMTSILSPTRLLLGTQKGTLVELAGDDVKESAPTFWVEEQHSAGNADQQDIDWNPPTDWDIAGPITRGNITAPAVPMPAFLKPPVHMDPRSIDPSSFPLPASQDYVAPLGTWPASQRSSLAHGPGQSQQHHLSVGADSMFCTCDLEGMMEEEDSAYHQVFGSSRGHDTPRVSISGSSVYHANARRCRTCMRRSVAANSSSNIHGAQPGSPTSGSTFFSRTSSMRRSRRKRKHEVFPSSKIAVAGRLYKDG